MSCHVCQGINSSRCCDTYMCIRLNHQYLFQCRVIRYQKMIFKINSARIKMFSFKKSSRAFLEWRYLNSDRIYFEYHSLDFWAIPFFPKRRRVTMTTMMINWCRIPKQPPKHLSAIDQFHKSHIFCTYSISHCTPFRTEMCTFLLWMVYCGIWDRCIMGFMRLVNKCK